MSLTERLAKLSGPAVPVGVSRTARVSLTERLAGLTGGEARVAVEKAPRESLTARLANVTGLPETPAPAVPAKPGPGLHARMAEVYELLKQTSPAPLTVPFAEWTPDRADFANPGSTAANNVVPTIDGYGPMADLAAYSDALDARAQGAVAAQDTDGNQHVYAGDAAKLYLMTGTAFADASKSGGYSTPADGAWEFEQFQQTLIATNYIDPVQSVAVGGGTFADLITSSNKPKMKHIGVIGDFLVGGNTDDAVDGVRPGRIWWPGINDPTDFDPAAATQSDFQDQAAGGAVQKVVGGREYGLIFQERRISRMVFEGGGRIFRIDPIDRKRGTSIPGSVIGWGRFAFFIADEGFMLHDGIESIPIGHNKVDKTFWDQFDITNFHRVSVAVDPVNKLVVWAFPGSGNVAGAPNKLYIYNMIDQRWSEADIDTEIVVRLTTQGFTLETLDTIGTDIDDSSIFPFSFDSRVYTGGQIKLGAFDTAHKLAFFDGANLAATLETTEIQPATGRRSGVTSVRPLVDGGTITAAMASRATLQESVAFGAASAINANGECPLRSEGRYHRARVSIAAAGTWTHAQGVEITAHPLGTQ